MKKYLKITLGLILLPIYIGLYFADRAICVINPLVNHFDIRIWFKNLDELKNSLIRVTIVTFVLTLVFSLKYLFSWLF
jgi:hypothetical protein